MWDDASAATASSCGAGHRTALASIKFGVAANFWGEIGYVAARLCVVQLRDAGRSQPLGVHKENLNGRVRRVADEARTVGAWARGGSRPRAVAGVVVGQPHVDAHAAAGIEAWRGAEPQPPRQQSGPKMAPAGTQDSAMRRVADHQLMHLDC